MRSQEGGQSHHHRRVWLGKYAYSRAAVDLPIDDDMNQLQVEARLAAVELFAA
jgi:hypothetical protein